MIFMLYTKKYNYLYFMFKIVEGEQVPQLLFSFADLKLCFYMVIEYLITFNLLYFTRKSTLYAAFKDETPHSQQLNSRNTKYLHIHVDSGFFNNGEGVDVILII